MLSDAAALSFAIVLNDFALPSLFRKYKTYSQLSRCYPLQIVDSTSPTVGEMLLETTGPFKFLNADVDAVSADYFHVLFDSSHLLSFVETCNAPASVPFNAENRRYQSVGRSYGAPAAIAGFGGSAPVDRAYSHSPTGV
jgi:hypothetical protein